MQPEPHWTSYVAIVTGIAGSIMGYIAYRRSNENKKSDRRPDLHKLRNDLHFAARKLLEIFPQALQSRRSALNARGLLNSSITWNYTNEHSEDVKRAKELSSQIPPADTNYESITLQQLEQEWVRLDRIKSEIDDLRGKYQDSIQQDREYSRKQNH